MTIGSASVKVVPDARGFSAKLREQLRDQDVTVKAKADTAAAKAELDKAAKDRKTKITGEADTKDAAAKLDEAAKDRKTTLGVFTKGDAEANAKIDRAARDRTTTIFTRVDTSGVSSALGSLSSQASRSSLPIDTNVSEQALQKARLAAQLQAAMDGRSATIKADADTAEAEAKLDAAARDRTTKITAKSDTSKIGWLSTAIFGLGPAAVPLGAAGVAGAAGLAGSFGAAALAAGTAKLAFIGMGGALKAANKEALDPSKTNLKAMNEALKPLPPSARGFVKEIESLRPQLDKLRSSAGRGLFSGLTAGIHDASSRFPELNKIVETVGTTLGKLTKQAGKSLGGPQWDQFFNDLRTHAGPALMTLGHTIGNVVQGLARMGHAFGPVFGQFGHGMESMSKRFDTWAGKLQHNQGFQQFLSYLQKEGPKVAHTLGDVAKALGHVLSATAPVGNTVLSVIDGIAKGLNKIPSWAITGGVGALAISKTAKTASTLLSKIPGLGGGRGGVGSVLGGLGKSGVVPVYVTNEGFGAPGKGKAGVGGVGGTIARDAENGGKTGILKDLFTGGEGLSAALSDPLMLAPAALSMYVMNHPPKMTKHTGQVLNAVQNRPGYQDPMGENWNAATGATLHPPKSAVGVSVGSMMKQIAMVAQYGTALKTLPKQVQTKVLAPGAQLSGKQVGDLAQKYHLTPKQVTTLVRALGAEGALSAAEKLGRQYGLTPKKVDTIIAQTAMNKSQAEIDSLARKYHLTPKQVRTIIDAKDNASGTIRGVQNELNGLHGKTVSVMVHAALTGSQIALAAMTGGLGLADGGTAGVGRAASGTTVRSGGTYRDKYPYLLAPGEEVISNRHGQADAFRPILKAINDGQISKSSIANYHGAYASAVRGSAPPPRPVATAGPSGPMRLVLEDGYEVRAYMEAVVDDRMATT